MRNSKENRPTKVAIQNKQAFLKACTDCCTLATLQVPVPGSKRLPQAESRKEKHLCDLLVHEIPEQHPFYIGHGSVMFRQAEELCVGSNLLFCGQGTGLRHETKKRQEQEGRLSR